MNVVAPPQSGVPLVSDENLFDSLFSSEQSLLSLLIAIRSANIDDDEKLELRDLVLEYAQITDANKRASVKDQLERILNKHGGIVETALNNRVEVRSDDKDREATKPLEVGVKVAPPTDLKRPIGAGRPRPVFKVAAPATAPQVVAEVPVITPIVQPPVEAFAATLSPEEKVPTPPAPASDLAPHVANPMERISEIKRQVNSKVGNPVNLIDSDNNVGREYMNALLDAMKKTSGSGLAGELDVAMARLEAAYLAVEDHIAGHPQILVAKEESKVEPEPKPAPLPEPEPEPIINKEIDLSSVAAVPTQGTESTIIPIKKLVINSEIPKKEPVVKEPELQIPEEVQKPEPKTSGAGLVQEPEEDFREAATADPKPSALSSLAARLFVDRSQTGVAAPKVNKTKLTPLKEKLATVTTPSVSVAKSEPVLPKVTAPRLKIEELPKEPALTPVSKDSSVTQKITSFREEMKKRDAADKLPVTELSAPEVTAGLSQLLAEWKLFKSSGFLGTGPSGINHPLYIKLKPMPMASVIAGRFEGANPEIKQSITDYMNGWRYEQGLIHEMGETFEHYLRRVILHILERQTETLGA